MVLKVFANFNGINYYENEILYLRIFIKLEKCGNKESKYYEEFWKWELKFISNFILKDLKYFP